MTIEKETRTSRSGACVLPQLLTGKFKKVDVEYKNGARYQGQVRGNQRSGQGIFTWPNGAHYDGEFVDNKRQGNGVQEWPDGSRYEGEFVEDYRHGSGRHTWSSGEVYEGNFYKDRRHGYGVYTWPDGSQFMGTFYTDKKEGYGTFTFANGSKFEGLYKDDEREGPGVLTHSDGKRDVGLWHREHLVKLCKSVNGAEFSLESHGYSPQLHEHRTRLSKSAAVGRRQEIIKSFVALQSSPEPLDYEFEPDPETVLRGVVSDLLPSCSLAADVYLYDKTFFAAASNRKSSGIGSNCQDNEDAASKQMDKETLNNVNNKIQEKSQRISAGKQKSNDSAMSGKRMNASSAKSNSKPRSAASDGTVDDDKVLAWNNTPSCIAMQTNVLRHRCGQDSVSFDVEALLCGERTGTAGDFGPIESASEHLILAAGAGDLATVARLLEAGEACVDVADIKGRTPLFAAAVNCHHNVINYLLDNGADVNKLDDEGLSALSACFVFLYPRESFLDNAADGIFAKTTEPTPATKAAASAKNTRARKSGKKLPPPRREPSKLDSKMIKELREEYGNAAQDMPDASNLKDREDLLRSINGESFPDGDNDDVESRLGTLSFQRAARSSSVEELINGGEPAEEATCVAATDVMSSKLSQFESHRTVNSLPVNVSDRQIVKCATILSKNGMIIDRARSANRDVWSEGTVRRLALEKSKRQQMKATALLLLKRGANPNASSVPMPALFFAVKCGDVETVRLLLEKGANPGSTLPESMGCLAPLHFSCGLLCKEGIEITKLLLNALADPDVRALEDDSFINHFLEEDWSKDELTVENLEILGGRTPLHVACAREDSYENACEIVRLLLSHHANTRVLCNGHSPLTLAITRGNDLAVHVLLSSGADPNLQHSHGIGSALCAATFTDNESRRNPEARLALIEQLLNAGANFLAPIAIGPRRLIGTVVDYANYVYNLDQRVGHVPYHALTVPERETFNARRCLLEHVGHLLRIQAVEQECERIREEEKAGKMSRNPSAGFVYTGHGARLESALQQQRRKPNSAASSFLSDTDVRQPLFRYCYECGRSVNVRLTPCPRCKEVYYCSKPCQNKAWATVHKDECLRLPQEGRKSGRGTSPGRGFAGEHSLERDGKGGGIYGRDADGAKHGKGAADVDELEDKLQVNSSLFPMASWQDNLPENCYVGNYSYI